MEFTITYSIEGHRFFFPPPLKYPWRNVRHFPPRSGRPCNGHHDSLWNRYPVWRSISVSVTCSRSRITTSTALCSFVCSRVVDQGPCMFFHFFIQNKWSNNSDKRPHCMSCRYWGRDGPFCCIHHSNDSQCFSMGRQPTKIAHSLGSLPHLIHGSMGPRESSPNRISIGSTVFAGFNSVPNRQTYAQTDRQTTLRVTSVALGCIYAMHVIRPKAKTGSFNARWQH